VKYTVSYFFFRVLRSGYRPQFATDFDVLWLKIFGLAQRCAFWASKVLTFSERGSKSPKSDSEGKSQLKIPYNFVIKQNTPIVVMKHLQEIVFALSESAVNFPPIRHLAEKFYKIWLSREMQTKLKTLGNT